MKYDDRDKLLDAIGSIKDTTVQEAKEAPKAAFPWYRVALAVACLAVAVLAVSLLRPGVSRDDESPAADGRGERSAAPYAIAQAIYPETADYPSDEAWSKDHDAAEAAMDAWWEATQSRRALQSVYSGALDGFLRRTVPVFLTGEAGENRAYSPLNVYLALSMLAEITDGNSRAQILTLLGAPDIETVRRNANALWNSHYQDDGMVASVLAASVWLRDELTFIPETLETLAENYYASSYRGEMGSPELDAALQGWLNEQTGGLLKEQAGNVRLEPETVMALATTIYFRGRWNEEFYEGATDEDVFHAPGGDVTCDFMHRTEMMSIVYGGESFVALPLYLQEMGAVWILLPDEGVTPEELVQSGAAMEFLLHGKDTWSDQGEYLVDLSLPKFDVSSETDLREGLRALGITDVFDDALSDFSPLTRDMTGVFLSQATHAVRVAVDEEGVTAAAFTVIAVAGTAMPQGEKYDFTVDRPFFFAVTGDDGLPLFTGVVNRPAA